MNGVSPLSAFADYVCPSCKNPLKYQGQYLCCPFCNRQYPVVGHIVDFLASEIAQKAPTLIRRVDQMDRGSLKWISGLYEGRFWYPLVISIYLGRGTTSFAELIHKTQTMVQGVKGNVLDAACGSATYGRRVASHEREVYGIDISMAMLQKGDEYIQQEGRIHVHLSRTQVETLPFKEGFFDFAICSGSLHLFPNVVAALKEIGRTLKPGAQIIGLTFTAGKRGLVKYGWFRDRIKKRGVIHLFTLPELEEDFHQAGYQNFTAELMGSGVFFTARKS